MKYLNKILLSLLACVCLVSFSSAADARISQTSETHIKQRHWYNANSGSKTSHFNRSMSIQKLDAISNVTMKNGSFRPSKTNNGRLTHQYTFKKPLGVGSNGKKAYKLRVVSDGRGNVVTAFPVN